MTRPALEQFYITYTETWQAWNTGVSQYPTSQRDLYRAWTGNTSPEYPRKLRHNSLEVVYSKFTYRGFFSQYRENLDFPHVWDRLQCVYAVSPPNFTTPSGMPAPGDANHIIEAGMISRNKAMDAAKDMKVNLAQFIAERRQVEKSITDVVNRLATAARAMKRRDLAAVRKALQYNGGPKQLSGRISQDWLAFQYGWKPLLGDVKGLAEHFARRELERQLKFRVHGRAKQTVDTIVRQGRVLGWQTAARYTYGKVTSQAHTILEFSLASDFAREGKELGLLDPLTLAWELLPYSFVVDWFLPVGDFLNRLDYTDGLRYHDGSTTLHTSSNDAVDVESATATEAGYKYSLIGGTVAEVKTLKLRRERHHPNPPRPILIPSLSDAYTPTRFFNALALLRVAFK